VGNFALKWFFGSQLLRLRPLLSRLRIVLSHVSLPFPQSLPQRRPLIIGHQQLTITLFTPPSPWWSDLNFVAADDAGQAIVT
jgi:hypothetical protein